jgi:hypothetical protein
MAEISQNKNYFSFNVDKIEVELPIFVERAGKKWIDYGVDNQWPGFVAGLFQKSAMNRTAIMSKLDGVIGQGLKTKKEDENYILKRANPKESWNDVFEKCALDYLTFGGYAMNIIWANDGETIAEFYHMDFTKVRSGIHVPDIDRPEFYYYSSDWGQYRRFRPIEYKAFDPACADTHPSQVLYEFDYEPGNLFYPLPSYAGSLNDIQIDVEVSKFHLSNLANGLNPGLFISMNNGIPDPESRQTIYDEVTMSFRGSENAGKAFIAFSDDADHAPTVTPIESANDDYYVNLESRITSRILTGHRITSPLLLGLYHEGGSGLGSNKDEIETAYAHFMSTVIKPLQKSMLKTFDIVVYYKGYETVELYIEPNKLIEAAENTIAAE